MPRAPRPAEFAPRCSDIQNCPEPCRLEYPQLLSESALLRGTIPAAWSTLGNLQKLGISGNALTGTLPAWMGQLPLIELGINDNMLSGTLGLLAEGAPTLTYLHAQRNKFTGTIPAAIGRMTGLNYLALGISLLAGTIPPEMGSLTNLVDLTLQKTRLTGTLPPELGALQKLELLGLGDCLLEGTLPASWSNMSALYFMALYNNNFSGTLPPEYGAMSSMAYLCVPPFARLRGGEKSDFCPLAVSRTPTPCEGRSRLRGAIVLRWRHCACPRQRQRLRFSANSFALAHAVTCTTTSYMASFRRRWRQCHLLARSSWASMPPCAPRSPLCSQTTRCGDGSACLAQACERLTRRATPQYASGWTSAGYSLDTSCTRRTCPENTWSASGLDAAGSVTGCFACPPGSSIADLGGISTPNVTAAHVGAGMCATGTPADASPPSPPPPPLPPPSPVCAPGYRGTPTLLASGMWSGCDAVVDRRPTIVGAVVGAVLGACLLVACAFALRRCRAQPAPLAAIQVAKDSSEHGSGSSTANMVISRDAVVLGDCLGTGGFAKVHAARWNGTPVAAKVFHQGRLVAPRGASRGGSFFTSGTAHGAAPAALVAEMQVLAALRHPNICAVYGIVAQPNTWLVMELCAGGSLMALLKRSSLDSLDWAARHDIGVGVASGVDFLHSQSPPVIHRDLKVRNRESWREGPT